MRAAAKPLPKNAEALRALVIDLQAQLQDRDAALRVRSVELAQRDSALQAGEQELVYLRTWIERLKLEIARLRRMQFGRSSEKLSATIEQLELMVEEYETSVAACPQATSMSSRRHPRSRHASPCPNTCRAKRSCMRPMLPARTAAPR